MQSNAKWGQMAKKFFEGLSDEEQDEEPMANSQDLEFIDDGTLKVYDSDDNTVYEDSEEESGCEGGDEDMSE